jgi:hypothetical protein
MKSFLSPASDSTLRRFVGVVGQKRWAARLAEIRRGCVPGHAGRALMRRHALELTLDRLIRTGTTPAAGAETLIASLAADLGLLAASLPPDGRERLQARLARLLSGEQTLVPLFHLLRCARIQRARGFDVSFTGLADGSLVDLLLQRDGSEAEVICETVSAEEGRDVHRSAWSYLVDRVDPDLQNWLAAHPGRYLLKMTLPQGLKTGGAAPDSAANDSLAEAVAQGGNAGLAALQGRITRLLSESRRVDYDEAAVLRLEPLLLAGAQATELGLMRDLRREFGHEAHIAVTAAGTGVFAMAARAAREDEVAEAMHRRMAMIAPARLSGTRPGILAMFIEDTDQLEWRVLRDQLQLEGAARQFLTRPEARNVVAVTCASRMELLGGVPPHAAEGGELRFRSPGHRHAKTAALAPALGVTAGIA